MNLSNKFDLTNRRQLRGHLMNLNIDFSPIVVSCVVICLIALLIFSRRASGSCKVQINCELQIFDSSAQLLMLYSLLMLY
jgi:hypothetical protein